MLHHLNMNIFCHLLLSHHNTSTGLSIQKLPSPHQLHLNQTKSVLNRHSILNIQNNIDILLNNSNQPRSMDIIFQLKRKHTHLDLPSEFSSLPHFLSYPLPEIHHHHPLHPLSKDIEPYSLQESPANLPTPPSDINDNHPSSPSKDFTSYLQLTVGS